MYVRITTSTLPPGHQEAAERLAGGITKLSRGNPDLKSLTFFRNLDTGVHGACAVWATKEALEAVMPEIQALMKERIGTLLKAPPQSDVYEVYEPEAS